MQCLYFIRAHRLPWRPYSYRTDAGAEVDLVLDTGRALLAIECKLGRNVTPGQLGGLHSFATATKRKVQSFVVFQGERAQAFAGGITAIPYLDFLRKTLPSLVD